MKTTNFIVLLCFSFLFFHCTESSTESSSEAETKPLLNTLWKLESIVVEGEIIKPPANQIHNILFKEDSTLSGKNNCNDYYAEYTIASDGSLILAKLVVTEVGCSGDESISDKYINGLHHAKSYRINENILNIFYGNNSTLVFFSE